MKAFGFIVAFCAFAAVPDSVRAHPAPWRPVPQQGFSASVEPLLAKTYWSLEESAAIKREIDACLAAGPAERCVDMALRGFSLIEEADLARILDTAERVWPIDLAVVAGERRAIPGAAASDVRRLGELALTSATVLGHGNEKTRRRELAAGIAAWRAGEDFPAGTAVVDEWIGTLGADHPLIAQLQSLRVAASLDTAWGGLPSADDVKWASDAYRTAGDLAATNLAAVRLRIGDYVAAETLAVDGYLALAKKLGDKDPRTLAAAMLVAETYLQRSKSELAKPYVDRVASIRARDATTTTREKLELLLAQSQLEQGAAGLAPLEKAIGLMDPGPTAQVKRLHGQILTEAAWKAIALNDLRKANDYARRARTADPNKTMAATLQAFSALMLPDLPLADRSGENHPEYLLGVGWNTELAPDHPERIFNAMVWTFYYQGWNPRYAPFYARASAEGAAGRLTKRQGFDESAAEELGQLRTVFELQVQSNWKASTIAN